MKLGPFRCADWKNPCSCDARYGPVQWNFHIVKFLIENRSFSSWRQCCEFAEVGVEDVEGLASEAEVECDVLDRLQELLQPNYHRDCHLQHLINRPFKENQSNCSPILLELSLYESTTVTLLVDLLFELRLSVYCLWSSITLRSPFTSLWTKFPPWITTFEAFWKIGAFGTKTRHCRREERE